MLQLCGKTHGMRARLVISGTIGLLAGFCCFFLMKKFHQGAADFGWSIHLAQRFFAGQNLYDTPYEQYPFTAGLFAMPFVHMRPEIAAGIFWGMSSALLALGLTRHGYTRLLIFLAFPYWAGILTVQWSPIIAGSAFFPLLLPLTMAKPQVGLPVFLVRLSGRGLLACVLVGIVSIIVLPGWPSAWISQSGNYRHFIPLLVLPGPILLLSLFRHKDRDTWLLLVSALMPQRWFFDSFILWLIPKSRREIVWTVFFSWGAWVWRWYHVPHSFQQVGRWTVILFYLPMLLVVMRRSWPGTEPQTQPACAGSPCE